jgi:hypothetical protein
MDLDIRLPLGLLLAAIGGLLVGFGALSDAAIYARSLGLNVNLWWGLTMLLVGATLAVLGWRRRK